MTPTVARLGAVAAVAAMVIAVSATAGATRGPTDEVAKTTIGPAVPTSVPGSTAPTATAPPPTVAPVPPGATRITDDTGRISVVVPSAWVDVNTAPNIADNGSDRPAITASPDLEQSYAGWTVPGLFISVVPPPADPSGWLETHRFDGACALGPVEPFDNGRFAGVKETWSNCGGGTAQIVHVGASTKDGTVGLFVQLQVPTPTDPAVALVLGSLDVVPGAVFTAPPAVNSATVPTVAPADPALVPTGVPAGSTRVVDQTGRLAISVPASFVDVEATPLLNDDGSNRPSIYASSNLDAFYNAWSPSGVVVDLYPAVDPASFLTSRLEPACTDAGLRPAATGAYTGFVRTWTGCGGTQTRLVHVALMRTDAAATVVVYVQLPDADNTPLLTVLASIELL